jgi:hypothetical protein
MAIFYSLSLPLVYLHTRVCKLYSPFCVLKKGVKMIDDERCISDGREEVKRKKKEFETIIKGNRRQRH